MDPITKAIDPYGDVLVLLPASTPTTKLQVSSKVLSTASPVFRSMFSPRFREGAALASSTTLVEIEFPDDPPQALEAIFNVLHFRHDCVSANVGSDALYEIATVADKYDLVAALGPWKEVWLRGGAGDGGRGLFVMYVFGDREGFSKGCRRAIVQDCGYGGGVGGDDEDDGGEGERGRENGWDYDALPRKAVGFISTRRTALIRALLSVAEHFRNLYQGPGIKCKAPKITENIFNPSKTDPRALTCDAAILGSLIRHEAAIGIFPVPSPPYKGISVENLALSMKGLRCFVDFDAGHGKCVIIMEVIKKVNKVRASVDKLDVWEVL